VSDIDFIEWPPAAAMAMLYLFIPKLPSLNWLEAAVDESQVGVPGQVIMAQ
jgi:hypothetical protein